jgi:hypothetical protein
MIILEPYVRALKARGAVERRVDATLQCVCSLSVTPRSSLTLSRCWIEHKVHNCFLGQDRAHVRRQPAARPRGCGCEQSTDGALCIWRSRD